MPMAMLQLVEAARLEYAADGSNSWRLTTLEASSSFLTGVRETFRLGRTDGMEDTTDAGGLVVAGDGDGSEASCSEALIRVTSSVLGDVTSS